MKTVKKLYKGLLEKITDYCWIYKKPVEWYYEFIDGVKNLYIWFPVIWKDRWWDSYYIYALLHKKLEIMEKQFRERGHHVGNDKDAHSMMVCKNLLKRIMDDDYSPTDVHEKKWGKADFIWSEVKDRPGYSTLDIHHENVKTPKDEVQEKKDFRRALDLEEYLKKQDIDLLFHLMKKHIRSWWD